ncbi:MAG: transposase [Alphaproteobacteria bacterium]
MPQWTIIKKKFEYMRKAYWGADGIWSDGYFVSTVSIDEGIIKRYIETHRAKKILDKRSLNCDRRSHAKR